MRLGLVRGEPHGCREIVDGELVLMLALIEQAALIISLRVVRLECDGLVQIGKRLRAAALFAVDDAAAKNGGHIAAVNGERLVVVGERQIGFAGPPIEERAVGVGLGVVAVKADRLVEVG